MDRVFEKSRFFALHGMAFAAQQGFELDL